MSLEDKAIDIHGKKYVQVKDRIAYLAEHAEDTPYSIQTEMLLPSPNVGILESPVTYVVKATLTLGENIYTGLAQEVETDDYKSVNKTSALENCETSAVGRACAMAGIGVIDSIASVDEINKAQNRELNLD